jgi:hypothetical protein
MSDGEAAVAFLRILLGCLVGTRCLIGPLVPISFADTIFGCRNGFFPRRDHVGVVSRAHGPRSRRQMEETRNAAVHDPPAAQASQIISALCRFYLGHHVFLLEPPPPAKSRYSHISLCLFYSSLAKFMLLVVLAIWGPQVRKDSPPPTYVYKIPFEGPLWHLLDDDVLDRTWLVRNLLGGMSAGFGLRGTLSGSWGPLADVC